MVSLRSGVPGRGGRLLGILGTSCAGPGLSEVRSGVCRSQSAVDSSASVSLARGETWPPTPPCVMTSQDSSASVP
ncbi:hypothetical protein H920_12812 [Fukomys damarensis]|uniref:Uncharacterized protein n=1 Tax=Fukomys damarensis TaxID=885580 RepID=A0A091DSC9_FUKDA|nr:hypothetical protein H920_12812 [Fukomys damarensis]